MADGARIGAIYRMNMDKEQDVTPKGLLDFRPKYCIIIGNAEYGFYVAYVLINKSINNHFIYTKELLDLQFPLRVSDYPNIFKIDPSYVNLGKIREMERTSFLEKATLYGNLTTSDCELILKALRNSTVLTPKQKKRYGLI